MHIDLTSGAQHGRTWRLYVWSLSRRKRNWRNGLDLCGAPPPIASAQTSSALGGAVRGHDAPLATSGQKHRWPPWLAVGCVLVRALDRVDGGEKTPRTRLGSVRGRKCRGAGVHWAPGRSPPADSG